MLLRADRPEKGEEKVTTAGQVLEPLKHFGKEIKAVKHNINKHVRTLFILD